MLKMESWLKAVSLMANLQVKGVALLGQGIGQTTYIIIMQIKVQIEAAKGSFYLNLYLNG
jgi:hypothetical protein